RRYHGRIAKVRPVPASAGWQGGPLAHRRPAFGAETARPADVRGGPAELPPMKTLADAWAWYVATRLSLEQMQRIGEKYWNDSPWEKEPPIGRDDRFRMLEAADITEATTASLAPVDDLAVVVLFSVFESLVRSYLVALIKPEVEAISDPILKQAANGAVRG